MNIPEAHVVLFLIVVEDALDMDSQVIDNPLMQILCKYHAAFRTHICELSPLVLSADKEPFPVGFRFVCGFNTLDTRKKTFGEVQ
jgi:hypothetical protein